MSSDHHDPTILTTSEGATLLRMSAAKLRDLAKSGGIPGFRVGPRWRFRRQDLLTWVEDMANRNVNPEARSAESAET
jgi:excisionase family DNA binding protein